jgi:hypothetical protein
MMFMALFLLVLVGMAAGLLALSSRTLQKDTQRLLQEVQQRDLQASGLAWIEHNCAGSGAMKAEAVELDGGSLVPGEATITIVPGSGEPMPACVEVRTRWQRQEHTMHKTAQYAWPR